MFGWPLYFLPALVRAGHLIPLGKPGQNSRKWFATVELEELCRDRAWLDKAIRIVERHVQQMNGKQREKLITNSFPQTETASLDSTCLS